MMPGRINGKRTRRRKRAFPGKVARIERERGQQAEGQRKGDAAGGDHQAVTTASQIGASPKSWRYNRA